jgi:RNA polymerase sigma factor (sigma-70 family)
MLTQEEAQKLMIDLVALRKTAAETKSTADQKAVEKQEQLCIEKFDYIVYMNTNRYKAFANYDDLVQEGRLGLVSAMKNYNPKKGSFFWWSNRYVQTRISRAANLHSTIRFPLVVAKKMMPKKEMNLPLLIDNTNRPDTECEKIETKTMIESVMEEVLTEEQKNIITLAYGIDGDKPMSINKMCKKLGITRTKCINKIDEAMCAMKERIQS